MASKSKGFNASASSNPLINPPALPHGASAFDKIKTEHIEPAIDWAIETLLAEIEAIKTNDELPTFENTIEALELAGSDFGRISAVFHTLTSNNTNDELRALEVEIDKKTTPIFSELSMDDAMFERIKAVYDAKDTLDLDNEQMMLLENAYKGRVRSGALLEPEQKETLKAISAELSEKTTQYAQNNVKAMAAYERVATLEELDGVPERALKSYQAAAQESLEAAAKQVEHATIALQTLQAVDLKSFKSQKLGREIIAEAQTNLDVATEKLANRQLELPEGSYLLKLQPFPAEVLSHCTNRALRKEINDAFGNVAVDGEFDNSQLVLDIVRLRHESAQLLGYDNHAEFILSDRMAGSQKAVEEFLEKNRKAYMPQAQEYFMNVESYAQAIGEVDVVEPHDFGYYSRKLKEEKFSFDTEALRPYFEINNVMDGFRSHIEKLFNVEMVDCTDDYPAYRDDAQVFEVKDKESGDMVALYYTDFYADAESKRGGAWMNPFRNRAMDKHGVDQIPIVTNSCNYQKPTEGQPSLLSLDEVRTIFHEGGHGFHGALGEGRYASLNGTSVKWDFVELPSQLMENWLGEPEVLKSFAKNHETGEPIPDEYIAKIKEMETYGSAYMGLRQTSLGLTDMLWHTTDPSEINSIADIEDQIHDMTSFFDERTSTMSTRFGHLFSSPGGYSAGYYSYKWAEVLEADVYEEFKRNGLYDQDTAQRLRDTIFSQGGKKDPMELFVDMMGREPDPTALYRREGLIANDNSDVPEAGIEVESDQDYTPAQPIYFP